MTGGINEVQLVYLAVFGLVIQRHAVRFNGDATLALKIHGVQYLSLHFALAQTATHLDKTVCQRRLAMVDVGNDGEITDMTQITHDYRSRNSAGLALGK